MSLGDVNNDVLTPFISRIMTAGIKLIIAFVLLFVSFKIVNLVARKIDKTGDSGKLDKTLARTSAYAFKLVSKLIIVICLVGFVGIDTSGLAALVVSLGAGLGLALNGALSNLAGGILLIITRPFRVDDFIEAEGYSGTVEEIHVTVTKIRTPDNKVVYIPNGPLSAGSIVNYSVKNERRVDLNFSIAYTDDFERAKRTVMDICLSHELVLRDPEPTVRVSEHAESCISLVTRVWVKSPDYWNVKYDLLEAVKAAFDREGITIPFNQLDVHVRKDL